MNRSRIPNYDRAVGFDRRAYDLARRSRRLSFKALAAALEGEGYTVSLGSLQRYSRGDLPPLDLIPPLARVLHVPQRRLTGEVP